MASQRLSILRMQFSNVTVTLKVTVTRQETMKKIFYTLFIILILTGCAPAQPTATLETQVPISTTAHAIDTPTSPPSPTAAPSATATVTAEPVVTLDKPMTTEFNPTNLDIMPTVIYDGGKTDGLRQVVLDCLKTPQCGSIIGSDGKVKKPNHVNAITPDELESCNW